MTAKRDDVTAAFELIVEAIEAVASEIADQGSTAFRDKAYELAQQLGESGKLLQSFRTKVVDLLDEWQSGIDVPTRQRFTAPRSKPTSQRSVKTHTKSPKSRIRVTFDDGKKCEEYFAADTFALALRHIGLGKVEALGIVRGPVPLVSATKSDSYSQRMIDGKYICTHSSTTEKKNTLEQIAKRLGISLRVEII